MGVLEQGKKEAISDLRCSAGGYPECRFSARIRECVLGFEKVYLRAKGGALDRKKSGLAGKIGAPLLFFWRFWKVTVVGKFFQWIKVPEECFQSVNLRTSDRQEE